MKVSIKRILSRGGWFSESYADMIADQIVEHLRSPEFAALYNEQCSPTPNPGLVSTLKTISTLKTMELTMSKLTDAMTALGQQIAAANSTANAAHLQAIDEHLTKLDAAETADAEAMADTAAGLQALLAAANGTATGTPAPATDAAPAA